MKWRRLLVVGKVYLGPMKKEQLSNHRVPVLACEKKW